MTNFPAQPSFAPAAEEPAPTARQSDARRRLMEVRDHFTALKNAWLGTDDAALTRRHAAAAFAIRVASAGLLYVSQVLLARWIGGHDYGIYVTVWTTVLALSSLSQLGFNTALIRLLPQYRERGEDALARGLLVGSRALALGAATAIGAIGILIVVMAGPAVASPYVWPILLGLVCLPMCALSDVHDGIGRAQGWMTIALAPPYIVRPLLVLLAMLVARMAGLPMTATTAIGAAIVATWSATAIQLMLIERKLAVAVPIGPRTYDVRGWLSVSLPLLPIAFADIVLQSTDVLVLSRFQSPEQVAIYFAAAKTMSLVMFVHYAVGSAVANRFAALGTRGDKAALQQLVHEAVAWTFWPSLAATLFILALGWPLLALFGPQFTAAYPAMFILAIGFLVRGSFGPGEFLLNMLGEQRRCARVQMGAAGLCIGLNLILVPLFGITGAAVATSIALMTGAVLNGVVAWQQLGLSTSVLTPLFKRLG